MNLTSQELKLLESSFALVPQIKKRKSKPCIIIFNGKQVATKSRKHLWPSKGAAKSAFKLHCQNSPKEMPFLFKEIYAYCNVLDDEAYKVFLENAQNSGLLQFKEID